ncbi:MAG: DUF222 domain-containing protein [Cryobacterium sp.]
MAGNPDPQTPAGSQSEAAPSEAAPSEAAPSEAARLIDQLQKTAAEVLDGVAFSSLSDDDAVAVLGAVENLGRRVDAARVASAADVGYRSRGILGRDSLAWKLGCQNAIDLITRSTRLSGQEVKRRMKLGGSVTVRVVGPTVMPPLYRAVASGLESGALGVDAAEVIIASLDQIATRVAPDDLFTAERALVASATGAITAETEGLPGAGFAFPADLVRGLAHEWQARLDPDGVAPNDAPVEPRSTVGFGQLRNGLYPLRGGVTAELRGVMNVIFDSYLSAHAAPAFPSSEEQALIEAGELIPGAELAGVADERNGGEKRADILRGVFESAGRDPGTPRMGGAAPAVMLHVNAVDLADDRGVGWIDGVEAPISLKTVKQMICAGGYQKIVFGPSGEVLSLGKKERFFTPAQRKAIAARDGGCIIPGCTVPAYWSEVHHVIAWRHHGLTDVDNGVLLCWYHHHTIDTSGWQIRMIRGKPEVKAPAWLDPTRTWRPGNDHRSTRSRAPRAA